MSVPLQNAQSEIVQSLLIALGLGTLPPTNTIAKNSAWPVYATNEPGEPDNCITTFDTTNQADGRAMFDGQIWQHYGFQVRVRAVDHPTGYQKIEAITVALAQNVGGRSGAVGVLCALNSYLVHAITGIGPVLALGKDAPSTKRSVFTLNAYLVL